MIRHRSRMFSAALACAVLMASTAALSSASATEYTTGPSWKAPAAQSAPMTAAPVEVRADVPMPVGVSPASVVACVAVGGVLALGVLHTNRPREKPRLRA